MDRIEGSQNGGRARQALSFHLSLPLSTLFPYIFPSLYPSFTLPSFPSSIYPLSFSIPLSNHPLSFHLSLPLSTLYPPSIPLSIHPLFFHLSTLYPSIYPSLYPPSILPSISPSIQNFRCWRSDQTIVMSDKRTQLTIFKLQMSLEPSLVFFC
jgi:hypothetical protein